jgi:phage gp36-like protein
MLLTGNRADFQENNNPDVLDSDQVQQDIDDADTQIDMALTRRYDTPFVDPIPSAIKFISLNIAAYLCDMRFRGSREYESERYPFPLRYDRARRLLDDLGSGRRLLNESEDDFSEVINPYEGTLMNTRHIFTRWPEGMIRDD